MLKELENLILPNDFTGSKLKHATTEMILNWTALQLAFKYGECNIQESDENIVNLLAHQLANYIYNCETTVEDIVEFLSIYLEKHFSLMIEDNSDRYIATRLLIVYADLEQGNEQQYKQLLADIEVYKEKHKNVNHQVTNQDSDGSDDEDNEEIPQLQQSTQPTQPVEESESEDEDGFQTVKPKRQFKKK